MAGAARTSPQGGAVPDMDAAAALPLGFHKLAKDPCYGAYAEALACECRCMCARAHACARASRKRTGVACAGAPHARALCPDLAPRLPAGGGAAPRPRAGSLNPRPQRARLTVCVPPRARTRRAPGLDRHDYAREFCADAFKAFNDCRTALVGSAAACWSAAASQSAATSRGVQQGRPAAPGFEPAADPCSQWRGARPKSHRLPRNGGPAPIQRPPPPGQGPG